MKNKLLGILLTLCFSTQSLAATFDSTEFSVDGNRFYFDVTLTLTPGNTTFAAFRIATAGTTAMAVVDGERIEINFDPITGALTFPPRVRAYGTPIDNRWQLTETIPDFTITENAPGVWRLAGSILHGTAPYTSGDTVAVMTFRDEFTGDDHLHDIPVTDYVPPLQCTMYTDRAAFEVAAPGLPTEDFEKTGVISDFDSPLDATTNIPPIVPGDILSGVAFSNPDFLQRLTLFDGTYASMTSDGISLSNSNDTDGLAVTFNPAVSAFGFDMFSERDSASVRIYNAGSSVLLGSYDGSAPQTGGFLGCVSPVPIGSVTIDAPANASGNIEALDNVSFGEPSVVPLTYTVGGSISGLTGSVTLQNNGGDNLVRNANGGFTFATELADSSAYAVTVLTQSAGQTCIVTNDSGTIATADVTDVSVTCADDVIPPIEPPPPAKPVPTLSQWALILFSILVGWMVFANRRRLFE